MTLSPSELNAITRPPIESIFSYDSGADDTVPLEFDEPASEEDWGEIESIVEDDPDLAGIGSVEGESTDATESA